MSETFSGIIWKVETDDAASIVAIESRDVSNRTTGFSAFDYVSGKTLFKEIAIEDGWFWSLDRVHAGMIFLHSYLNENSPEHKGIIAINSHGDIVWQQFHKTLHDVSEQGLIVYNPKINPKLFELVSPLSGETLGGRAAEYSTIFREISVPEIISNSPELNDLLPVNIFGPVLHYKMKDIDILAYHIKIENLYTQQISLYQGKTLVLQDNLATGIQKLNPEAFFIQHNYLFYIRSSKQEFVSYLV